MGSVTPVELEALRGGETHLQLLDVREPWEFDLCHIDGSFNIPMDELMGRLDGMRKDETVVVICHHGARSRQVAAYLETLGFADIYNLAGGVDAWSREVDPDMPQY